jgi:hypothetical protein
MLDVKEVSHRPYIAVMLAFSNFLVGVICFFSNLLDNMLGSWFIRGTSIMWLSTDKLHFTIG